MKTILIFILAMTIGYCLLSIAGCLSQQSHIKTTSGLVVDSNSQSFGRNTTIVYSTDPNDPNNVSVRFDSNSSTFMDVFWAGVALCLSVMI